MNLRKLVENHKMHVRLNELGQHKLIKAKISALPNLVPEKVLQNLKEKPEEVRKQAENFNTKRLLNAKARQTNLESYKNVPRVIAKEFNAKTHNEFYQKNAQRQSFAENKLRESFAENASKHALQQLGLSNLKDLNIKQTNMTKLVNKARENSTTRGETIFNKDKALRNITASQYKKYNNIREAYFAKKIAETPQSNIPKPITDAQPKIPEESEEEYVAPLKVPFESQPLLKTEQASPPIVPKKSNALLTQLAEEASAATNQYRTKLPNSEFATLLPIQKSQREILGLQRTAEFLNLVNKRVFKIDNETKQKIETSGFSRNMLSDMVNKLNDPKQTQILLELYKRTNPDSESVNSSGVVV